MIRNVRKWNLGKRRTRNSAKNEPEQHDHDDDALTVMKIVYISQISRQL